MVKYGNAEVTLDSPTTFTNEAKTKVKSVFRFTCPNGKSTTRNFFYPVGMDITSLITEMANELCPTPPPPPVRECAVGETKCIDGDLYWCRDGVWTLQQYGSPQCAVAPPVTPPVTCARGDVYAPLPFQKCDVGYTRKFDFTKLGYYCYSDAVGAAPPSEPVGVTVDVPPPPAVVEKCPRGDIYTKPMFRSCDPGYYQGDLPGAGIPGMGMACICSEDYVPPHVENGVVVEENGILAKIIPDIDLSGLSKIFDLLPMIILAAVGIAVLGMFKR